MQGTPLLLSCLTEKARRQESASFTISFNRQQPSDYLEVDQGAMANELRQMRDKEILGFEGSRFPLLACYGNG